MTSTYRYAAYTECRSAPKSKGFPYRVESSRTAAPGPVRSAIALGYMDVMYVQGRDEGWMSVSKLYDGR